MWAEKNAVTEGSSVTAYLLLLLSLIIIILLKITIRKAA